VRTVECTLTLIMQTGPIMLAMIGLLCMIRYVGIRTLAGAVIGVGIGAWYTAGEHATPRDYITALDTGLDLLERGLRL
jgi:hypothetical protein